MKSDEKSLRNRTLTAWVRRHGADRMGQVKAVTREIVVTSQGPLVYMVVRGPGRRILDVYRVRTDNILKHMKRPPAELKPPSDDGD